jgi:hypothetical protein
MTKSLTNILLNASSLSIFLAMGFTILSILQIAIWFSCPFNFGK